MAIAILAVLENNFRNMQYFHPRKILLRSIGVVAIAYILTSTNTKV